MKNTLVSLATLRVIYDHLKKSYIESFIPFIATLIKKKNYKSIDAIKFCEDFKEEYGLAVPYHPMVSVLNRAKRRGLLKKDRGQYIPLTDEISKYDFTRISDEQNKKQELLISKFVIFCKDHYGVDISTGEAEETYIEFIKKYDLDILFASGEKSILPEVKKSKRNKYLFSCFLQHIYSSEHETFTIMIDTAMGNILASVLLYEPLIKNYAGKLSSLNIYCDTAFILKLTGIDGPEIKLVYENFLKDLEKQGVKLFIFNHTYDEIYAIFETALKWLGNPNYDPSRASIVTRYFVEHGYTRLDVENYIVKIGILLKRHRISIFPSPDSVEHASYQIDEDKLHRTIIDTYQANNPYFEEWINTFLIQRDVQSISNIYKLRHNKKPKHISNAKYIFVTTNNGLASASYKFDFSENGASFRIPVCVTDIFLGTLTWLQSPTTATMFNEKKIIADCFAALHTDHVLIKKFIKEVERLKEDKDITTDDYYLLRSMLMAREMLSEQTMNDPDNFTSNMPLEILNKMKDTMRAEEYKRYLEEKEKVKILTEEYDSVRTEKDTIESNIYVFAGAIANIMGQAINLLVIMLFLVGVYFQFDSDLHKNKLRWYFYIIITSIFGVSSIIYGLNLKNMKDRIIFKIKSYIIKQFKDKKTNP